MTSAQKYFTMQRLMSNIEDKLRIAYGHITHHAEAVADNEEKSPTFENMMVLSWLRLADRDLPNLVKQRYVTELRSRSLTSIKPVISQALQ